MEFAFEFRQEFPIQYRGKCLGKPVDRWDGNGEACAARVVQQKGNQRGWQQGQIDRQKDREARGSRGERRTDSGQWAPSGLGIRDERGKCGEGRGTAGQGRGEAGRAHDVESVQDERLTTKPNQGLVFSHAAGSPSSQDKAGGIGIGVGVCFAQTALIETGCPIFS